MNPLIEESFEEVLRNYEKIIYYHIHKLHIHDPHQEFYQEGLYALWQAYQTFQPNKSKLSTYLHSMIHNHLIDVLRKQECQQRYDRLYIREIMTHQESGNRCCYTKIPVCDEPWIASFEVDLWQWLHALLTVNQWKWVKYFILKGLSNHEIAMKEGVSVAAVHSWAKTAKVKLKKEWGNLEHSVALPCDG
ncbi:sigma-70 family RNA polymerase sigma factor [Lentibacillus sp. N15]|uniref:RNA polymerase sigma factor n=1 Tax=Lentibacillus songyuanensis TaxID=3136161 RepID=UPI0031BB6EA7